VAIRGLGQVKIGRVELTDGLTVLRPLGWPRGRYVLVGKKAPHRGFPVLAWNTNAGVLPLDFAPQTSVKNKAHPRKGAPVM
jgi:hypothetical protein